MFLDRRKAKLRAKMKNARLEAGRADPDVAEKLLRQFPTAVWPSIGQGVGGYFPVNGEIDPRPLMAMLACEGAITGIPVCEKKGRMHFRQWAPGDPTVEGAHGVPCPTEEAERMRPTLILVPVLAFDARGRRLGYGAGYYDRALELMRVDRGITAVGLAYEAQRVKRVPTKKHDQLLDWIVTERGAWRAE